MSNIALFNLTAQYRQLLDTLLDGDFDAVTISDSIEASGIVDDIAAKAQGLEMVARSLTAHCPTIDAEIARLSALKRQRENAAAGLRAYLLHNMIASSITKLESPLFKISLRNNPASVEVFDEKMVPACFMTKPVAPAAAPDKSAIKKAIAGCIEDGKVIPGIDVPGCRMTAGQRLVVS